jgi:anti-anti-sigma factor
MGELAVVRFEVVNDATVVRIIGEVDLSNAWSVSQAMRDAISNQAHRVVIDLTEVGYLDSAGIRILFELARSLADHDQRLIVVLPGGATIRRALEVTALSAADEIVGTMKEAIGSS